jgi:hypothetical protein
MKIVGEALQVAPLKPDEKIITLGIANWCTVTNNHLLIKKKVFIQLFFKHAFK